MTFSTHVKVWNRKAFESRLIEDTPCICDNRSGHNVIELTRSIGSKDVEVERTKASWRSLHSSTPLRVTQRSQRRGHPIILPTCFLHWTSTVASATTVSLGTFSTRHALSCVSCRMRHRVASSFVKHPSSSECNDEEQRPGRKRFAMRDCQFEKNNQTCYKKSLVLSGHDSAAEYITCRWKIRFHIILRAILVKKSCCSRRDLVAFVNFSPRQYESHIYSRSTNCSA